MTAQALGIDPFAHQRDGAYADEMVRVSACRGPRPRRGLRTIRTEHFDVEAGGGTVEVRHVLAPDELSDDLAGLLATELFGPGWLRGAELFERIFTGVVITSAPDPLEGWELFYRNTLARLEELTVEPDPPEGAPHGTLTGYAPVYAHVEGLVAGRTVLELGSCFGFLSLRLAARGHPTVASDVNPGTVELLSRIAPRLGVPVHTRVADAARVPYAPASVDTVLAVHLLEHLDPDHGDRVLGEALRLAARRVVVAVPLEEEADETWGHVRTVAPTDLEAWGVASGWTFEVHEHHGGWLILDRP